MKGVGDEMPKLQAGGIQSTARPVLVVLLQARRPRVVPFDEQIRPPRHWQCQRRRAFAFGTNCCVPRISGKSRCAWGTCPTRRGFVASRWCTNG